jgi:hypothetical protein
VGAVLRLYIPDWPLCRAALGLSAYGGFLAVLGIMLCVTPAQALLSHSGYARIASQSAMNALSVAQRSLASNALGSAIASASGPGSVAVRLVTSSVGWPALGVLAGLTLLQIALSSNQVQDIQAAAAQPGGFGPLPGATGPQPAVTAVIAITGQYIIVYGPVVPDGCMAVYSTKPPTWISAQYEGNCALLTPGPVPESELPPALPPVPATAQNITDYVHGLPANDPNSLESNTTAVGAGVAPSPAATVASVPVSASQVETAVVPASSVSPTDTVVDPSAPAPAGTQTAPVAHTSTTTTVSTVNPDGSVTESETSAAVSSCTAGEHDARSFGSILQTHMETWRGSGIAGALSTLQLLTWPSASPTYTLNSGLLGTFSFDFTAWNGILLALRSLIIAGAGFAAYRIIFVGGSGGGNA